MCAVQQLSAHCREDALQASAGSAHGNGMRQRCSQRRSASHDDAPEKARHEELRVVVLNSLQDGLQLVGAAANCLLQSECKRHRQAQHGLSAEAQCSRGKGRTRVKLQYWLVEQQGRVFQRRAACVQPCSFHSFKAQPSNCPRYSRAQLLVANLAHRQPHAAAFPCRQHQGLNRQRAAEFHEAVHFPWLVAVTWCSGR